jgi:hypothetical protein
MTDPDEPVVLARFLDVRQAEFVRSVLEGSEIEAYLDQPFAGSIVPHYMLGSGGIRLFVAAKNKERALDVLATLENDSELPADDDDSHQEE